MASPIDNRLERALLEALDALHLPQMPADGETSSHVLRVLVVADLDLPSASRLAEYTLQQSNLFSNASAVDLCIACGSFTRDDDLLPYLRGKQARRQLDRQHNLQSGRPQGGCAASPYFRTREETAALEGLMTAALSQLESIVCRVIYCPGSQDPVTSLFSDRSRRLTPNSRNVYQQWLPLAPGIGCAALLYLDSAEAAVKAATAGTAKPGFDNDHDHDDASDGYDDDEEDNVRRTWSEKWLQIHRSMNSVGYCRALDELVQLAPPANHPVPFAHSASQTILVTHYVDCLGRATTHDAISVEQDCEPWPSEPHASFLRSALVQKLLCLEIASGSAANYMPELIEKGNSQVLLPGSLRERGEFCILEIALSEEERAMNGSSTAPSQLRAGDVSSGPLPKQTSSNRSTKHRSFAWKVQKVDFHRLNQTRERV